MNNINLSELTFDNIGHWPAPVKIAAVAISAVLVMALGYWVLIKPNLETLETLKQQEVNLKSEFELKQHQAANLQKLRNQLQLMQEKFGAMLKRLPSKHEMPGLLEDISKTGITSGLKFELFAPQGEVEHDFYIEQPIKIQVVGNYHQLAIFLSRVAQMSRIVTMHDFTLEGVKTKNKKEPSDNLLLMDMTAKIYRYRTI